MNHQVDIEQLTPGLARGDEHAFRALARELSEPLFRYAAALVQDADRAEEVVQLCLVRVFRNRRRLRQGSVRSFCFRIARNLGRNLYRDAGTRRRYEHEAESMRDQARESADPQRLAMAGEAWTAAAALPDELREPLLLVAGHGFSLGEAAEILELPKSTVGARVNTGLERLRTRFATAAMPLGLLGLEDMQKVLQAHSAASSPVAVPSALSTRMEVALVAAMTTKLSTVNVLLLCGALLLLAGAGAAVTVGWPDSSPPGGNGPLAMAPDTGGSLERPGKAGAKDSTLAATTAGETAVAARGESEGASPWIIKGRIKITPEEQEIFSYLQQGLEVMVNATPFRRRDYSLLFVKVADDLTFEERVAPSDFCFKTSSEVPSGYWQVLPHIQNLADSHTVSFLAPENGRDVVPAETMVQPVVRDRVIDLGEVDLGLRRLLEPNWFLVVGKFKHASGRALEADDHELVLYPDVNGAVGAADTRWGFSDYRTHDWKSGLWDASWAVTGGDADVVPASHGQGGCFLACVDLNQFHSAKRKAWEQVLQAPCPWAFRTEASAFQALCTPVHRMGGKVVDLGDVVSNDALIDFSFETPAPAPKDSSRARVEFVRYGEGTRDELSNGAYCYEDRGTSLLLRPGRWTYRATASNDGDKKVFYDSVQGGPILAPARTVTPVHVSFKPAALIPVRFEMPDGTPCTDPISLSWRTNKDDLWDEICEDVNPQGAMVDAPRVKDGPSFYCGSSKMWADVDIEIGPEAREAVIRFSEPKSEDELADQELNENPPEDAVVLVIEAPHLPPELEDDCKRPGCDAGLSYRLQAANDEEIWEYFPLTPGRPLRVRLYDLLPEGFKDDAELLITLVGGAARGYARGIVSGPVRVTLKPGEVVKVALPPIPSPPWAYRASGCQGALVCGGEIGSMSQLIRTAEGGVHLRSGTDSTWSYSGLVAGFYDGAVVVGAPGEEYPLRLLPPEHENACAYFAAEVPVRIRVKVPAGHPWLRASVSWPSGEGSSAAWCSHSATPVDGVINLWCPAGRRVVRIAYDGGPGEADKSFEVEVSESGVLEIQAETASSMVCFTGGCYENGTTSGWKVFHMSPTGCEEYECRVLPELTRSHHRYLLPGDYIARPEDVRVDANVHFEVVAGEVTHVQLPSLGPAPVGGTVVLLFDVKDLISWDVSVDCKVASSNPALNLTPDWAMNSKIETFCTLSANGVEVSGVPLGVPVVFRCFAHSPDDKQRLASKPFLWCVEGDQRTHEVQWLAACPERSEWDAMTDGYDTTDEWFWQRDVSSLPGFAIGFVQAPGTYEVALYDSNEREFARVTVTITADGRGPIPEDARNILLQRGMLRPTATQPAEKAPEGGEAPQPGNGE